MDTMPKTPSESQTCLKLADLILVPEEGAVRAQFRGSWHVEEVTGILTTHPECNSHPEFTKALPIDGSRKAGIAIPPAKNVNTNFRPVFEDFR